MADLSPQQIAALWLGAGGSRASVITAVAVAWAESGGNTAAESPSDDWGLWQINGQWTATFGVTRQGLLTPYVNAYCAVQISGHGTNFAAWCTMWADPARDCGHGQITAPQVLSPAWNAYPLVLAVLGGSYPAPGPGSPAPLDAVQSAWGALAGYLGHDVAGQWQGIAWARANNRAARRRML